MSGWPPDVIDGFDAEDLLDWLAALRLSAERHGGAPRREPSA